MRTKFVVGVGHEMGKEYDDLECPLLQFKMLVYGPWGNLRVTDVCISINEASPPKQTVFLGLVNIHG